MSFLPPTPLYFPFDCQNQALQAQLRNKQCSMYGKVGIYLKNGEYFAHYKPCRSALYHKCQCEVANFEKHTKRCMLCEKAYLSEDTIHISGAYTRLKEIRSIIFDAILFEFELKKLKTRKRVLTSLSSRRVVQKSRVGLL